MSRKVKAGKFAGRSLFKVERTPGVAKLHDPATWDTPAKRDDVRRRLKANCVGPDAEQLAAGLDAFERDARTVLERHGYRGAAIVTEALTLPANAPAGRAARIVVAVAKVRQRITFKPPPARRAAEMVTVAAAHQHAENKTHRAALAMLELLALVNHAGVDLFAPAVLRDGARQRGAGEGGRTKRRSAVPAWKEAAATALRATAPKYSAEVAWAWLVSEGRVEVKGGAVEMESDGLHFDGSDSGAKITYETFRGYVTKARAEIDAADFLRSK